VHRRTGEVQDHDCLPPLNTTFIVIDTGFTSAAEMSSQSVKGGTTSIESTLNAILRCLDVIEVKMQPLQDQVAVLEAMVQEQAA
jgi:hypothetical protein